MPRNQTLLDSLTGMVLDESPASLDPREAAELYRKLVDDEGVQERAAAGDRSLTDWIGQLRARADGVDPHASLSMDTDLRAGFDRGLRRETLDRHFEKVDHEADQAEKAAQAAKGEAMRQELNKRVQMLTAHGFDGDVALKVAMRGDAEVARVVKLDPASYERGYERERDSLSGGGPSQRGI